MSIIYLPRLRELLIKSNDSLISWPGAETPHRNFNSQFPKTSWYFQLRGHGGQCNEWGSCKTFQAKESLILQPGEQHVALANPLGCYVANDYGLLEVILVKPRSYNNHICLFRSLQWESDLWSRSCCCVVGLQQCWTWSMKWHFRGE